MKSQPCGRQGWGPVPHRLPGLACVRRGGRCGVCGFGVSPASSLQPGTALPPAVGHRLCSPGHKALRGLPSVSPPLSPFPLPSPLSSPRAPPSSGQTSSHVSPLPGCRGLTAFPASPQPVRSTPPPPPPLLSAVPLPACPVWGASHSHLRSLPFSFPAGCCGSSSPCLAPPACGAGDWITCLFHLVVPSTVNSGHPAPLHLASLCSASGHEVSSQIIQQGLGVCRGKYDWKVELACRKE